MKIQFSTNERFNELRATAKKKAKTLKRETIILEEKLYLVHYKFLVIRGKQKSENKSVFIAFC